MADKIQTFGLDEDNAHKHRFSSHAMGTNFEIAIGGLEEKFAGQAAREAFAELKKLDEQLSRFIPYSDISRINRAGAGERVLVGFETLECLTAACQMFYRTDGAFDISLGSGLESLEIYPQERVVVRHGDISLDLGGIGKGYAVDVLAAYLREFWQANDFLVHGGWSSIWAQSPAGPGWKINIVNPDGSGSSLGKFYLQGRSVSGSGVLEQGEHIIDPRAGHPPRGKLSAWAIASTGAEADALSTAFFVWSAEEIRKYCAQFPGSAGMIAHPGPAGAMLEKLGPWDDLVQNVT